MAGRRTTKPVAPTLPSNSLVASAVRYPGRVARVYVGAKEWQKECYRHYGICGEARYAATYFGHALARAHLYVTADATKEAERLTDGPAVDALNALFNGDEGQEQMLTAIGTHLTIAGECYLVGRTVSVAQDQGPAVDDEVWEVLSVLEVKKAGETWSITSKEEGEADVVLSEDDVVIRIWRPHPQRRLEADSPFRAMLPVLTEIEYLTLRIFAECRSRLTGGGLMFVSQDVTFPEPPEEWNGQKLETTNQATGMLYTLAESMLGAVKDQGSPEALMPVLATVPSEVWKDGGKVAEMFDFWTKLDENALGMRQGAIHRFALGMDMPPEKMLGVSSNPGTGGGNTNGVSHWGAWQIDEDYIRMHIEPALGLVCNALVIGFLRPLTEGLEYVRADTAGLRLRPDRSKESLELYRLGLISGTVVIRENGFNPDTDAMKDDERKVWLQVQIATGLGSATPEQVQSALRALGVDLGPLEQPDAEVRGPKALPSIADHPTRREPEAANLLLAVSEPLVLTALQRAGNKLKPRGRGGVKAMSVPAYEVHTVVRAGESLEECLTDAFPHAAMCLNGVGEPEKVVPALEGYVRTLIESQQPHTRDALAIALEDVA